MNVTFLHLPAACWHCKTEAAMMLVACVCLYVALSQQIQTDHIDVSPRSIPILYNEPTLSPKIAPSHVGI